jgi:hypothetical protein
MYYMTYSEQTWCEDPGDGSDEQYSWEGGSGCAVTVRNLSLTKPSGEYVVIDPSRYGTVYDIEQVMAGQKAYVVIVVYQDGGTFGYYCEWRAVGLYATQEAAEAVRKQCEAENDTERAYRPWDGYFASLREARVEEMTLTP